ncbi:hypothetical protein [Pseudomonas abietaniphila]|uniref:hypothetical protein n=1 Tax=Pseudomonas abietaniphila TaxID=89065 RepID=UPI0007867593|nr:hypothetical protein [Pseudomonas abietaniphila]
MLSFDDQAELAMAICATAETLGQTISPSAAQMMAEDLAEHTIEVIASALRSCRRELTGRLTLGAILQRIQAADGRPGKDEAWSIAMAASDEFDTVVLTPEIRQAMSASGPILDAGDKVGARMAFLSAYERLVSSARAEGTPLKWEVSLGYDQARRVQAIESAVRSQLISQDAGTKYLADLRIEPVTEDGRAVAGLLTGTVSRPSADVRAKLKVIKDNMAEMNAASEERRLEMKIQAANELAERRALLNRQAEELAAKRVS